MFSVCCICRVCIIAGSGMSAPYSYPADKVYRIRAPIIPPAQARYMQSIMFATLLLRSAHIIRCLSHSSARLRERSVSSMQYLLTLQSCQQPTGV
jgi:hypothetical protein